jgi:hypothetical protein
VLSRLRNWIRRVGSVGRRNVDLTHDGFVTGRKLIRWADIASIIALKRDIYLGEVVCLAVASKDGTTCHVCEGDAIWRASLDAVTRRLAGVLPLEEWFPDVAAGKRDFVTIYGSVATAPQAGLSSASKH